MFRSWLQFLTAIVILSVAEAFQQIGYPNFTVPSSPPSSPPSGSNLVLLSTPVAVDGILFAYSATINSVPKKFDFHVYRPVLGSTYDHMLISKLTVTPSVSNRQEYFYMESFLGTRPCVRVMPGDRLGLFFYDNSPPVNFYFDGNLPTDRKVVFIQTATVQIGQIVSATTFLQPFYVAAGAYIVESNNSTSNSSSTSNDIGCVKGLNLISNDSFNQTQPTSTTTYLPPIGVSGAQGPQGDSGATGVAGEQGSNGTQGIQGKEGLLGASGVTGPAGVTGEPNFHQGVNSTDVGLTGAPGVTGLAGPSGQLGRIGINGSMGEMGSNYTVYPARTGLSTDQQDWFLTINAMQGVYIWLAIDSFVLLVIGLVTLIVVCCLHTDIKHDLAIHSENGFPKYGNS